MKINYRTQNDGKQKQHSLRTASVYTREGNKDMARQEFKDESDINVMLSRFGVQDQQRTAIKFGEADYTIDLQQALHSVHDARRAYQRMDPQIHELYPSFEKFLRGMDSGSLAKDLTRLDEERKPAARKAELRTEIDREKERAQIVRDDEAAKIAEDHRNGVKPPKPEEKPKLTG